MGKLKSTRYNGLTPAPMASARPGPTRVLRAGKLAFSGRLGTPPRRALAPPTTPDDRVLVCCRSLGFGRIGPQLVLVIAVTRLPSRCGGSARIVDRRLRPREGGSMQMAELGGR